MSRINPVYTVAIVVFLHACQGTPTRETTPPPILEDTFGPFWELCGDTAPVVASGTVENNSAEQDPLAASMLASFVGVTDLDGDLYEPGAYIIAVDTVMDGRIGDDAQRLTAPMVFQADRCLASEGDAAFNIPVALFPDAFPTPCIEYEFALFVVDSRDNTSEPVFVTARSPGPGGTPCDPTGERDTDSDSARGDGKLSAEP